MARLTGKTAVITGASSGIGLATARLFLDEGAAVLITGADPDRLDRAGEQLSGRALVQRVDVRDLATLDALASRVAAEWGGLHVLFANAGVTFAAPFGQVTAEAFDDVVSVNLRGTYFTVHRLLPVLRPGASVVLTTSSLQELGAPAMSVYAATKAAVRSLARSLSAELLPVGVRVNAVAPGPVDTGMILKLGVTQEQADAALQQTAQRIPLQRVGTAEEVALTALFLASDDSRYIVGASVPVDGGWTDL